MFTHVSVLLSISCVLPPVLEDKNTKMEKRHGPYLKIA